MDKITNRFAAGCRMAEIAENATVGEDQVGDSDERRLLPFLVPADLH
jgi:hypothetical protein